jgi:hypothetical protein
MNQKITHNRESINLISIEFQEDLIRTCQMFEIAIAVCGLLYKNPLEFQERVSDAIMVSPDE